MTVVILEDRLYGFLAYRYHSRIAVSYQKTDYRVFSKYMHHSKNVVIIEDQL